MKVARRLRQEVDLWAVRWQEVETFLDRISGAADQDATPRRVVEALLVVAGVVERARAPLETQPLGAPAVAELPTHRTDGSDGTEPITDAWALEDRKARLPGLDDLELAAGPVSATDHGGKPLDGDLKEVRLMAPASVPAQMDAAAGGVTLGAMPSYAPEVAGGQSSVVPPSGVWADVTDDLSGLFSVERRIAATMGTEPDQEQVRTWGELAADRRQAAGASTKIPFSPPSVAGRAATLAAEATEIVDGLRAGTVTAQHAAAALSELAAAPAAQGDAGTDADDLDAAAELLEEEGTTDATLPDDVRALAAAFRSTPAAQQALVQAVTALAAAPTSTSRQDAVLTTARQVGVTSSSARLLASRVEDGPLRAELDAAVATRLQYPDGGLRMVRTLETAFALSWPERVRWFTCRRDLVLAPLFARFRRPFHASVRALVDGGDTGLLTLGLTVGPSAAVGATQVVTGEPASLLPTVDDLEPGQVGTVRGDRSAVLTVLGIDVAHGFLALQVAPIRISTAPGGAGLPGVVDAGTAILATASGLSDAELREGRPAEREEESGVVAETLALWSQCCAVFGRASFESAAAAVPDPVPTPLEQLTLQGTVPARATTLVLTGLPSAAWDRTDPHDPLPVVARVGESLLLRGTTEPEDGGPARAVQGVVEVDAVVRTTGSMLDAMDLSAAALLSTAPPAADGESCAFRCGPEDDVAVVTLRHNTVDVPLSAPVTLRRDFAGFDVISLATGRLLPPELFGGAPEAPVSPGVDRSREFDYANDLLTGWLRYAHHA